MTLPADRQPDQVPPPLRRVAEALSAQSERRAVRRFRRLCESDQIASGPDDLPALIRQLGPKFTTQLIDVFARTRCYYCRGGLERCEDCSGKGYHDNASACETCVGIGLSRCDCCDGSGWVAIDAIPEVLRVGVILDRARLALREIRQLSETLDQTPRDPQRPHALRRDATVLLRLNGLLGVLENDIIDASQLHIHSHRTLAHLEQLRHEWIANARETQSLMRDVLRRMELDARKDIERNSARPGLRKVAEARVALYRQLRRDHGFEQTGLDHPYLQAAIDSEPPTASEETNE